MSKEKTITIRLERPTKNTFKYQEVPEDGEGPIAGTLYLQKWFAGSAPAQEWEVTFRPKTAT